jgi:hypothetical protein
VAAIAIFGVFGDRIRALVGGASVEIGADQTAVDTATSKGSAEYIKDLDKDGAN